MLRFLIRRGLSALGLLFVVSIVSFVLIKAPPGDYADYAAALARSQGGLSYEQSLDTSRPGPRGSRPQPAVVEQYLRWISGMVLRGDFGTSFVYNKPVDDLLVRAVLADAGDRATCHLLATLIGVGLGIVGAVYQHRLGDRRRLDDRLSRHDDPALLHGAGHPLLARLRRRLPVCRRHFVARVHLPPMSFAKLWDTLKHVWPIIFIAAFGGLAYNMRVMRGNLLDVLRQPYIEAARAKGVPGHKVVLKHAVPNALHPLVMYQGVAMPYMLSGELEVAIVLGIPTIGPLMLDSLYRNDVWVTTTIFLWLSAVLVVANLLADIVLGLSIRACARRVRYERDPRGPRCRLLETSPTRADRRRRAIPPVGEPQPPQEPMR